MFTRHVLAAALFLSLPLASAQADDDMGKDGKTAYQLTLQDHKFSPDPITLPRGTRATLVIQNNQSTPAEFESSDLSREKVVGAGKHITVLLGPLEPGRYHYVDDFHRETTGTILVK